MVEWNKIHCIMLMNHSVDRIFLISVNLWLNQTKLGLINQNLVGQNHLWLHKTNSLVDSTKNLVKLMISNFFSQFN